MAGSKTYSVDISEDVVSAFSAKGTNKGNKLHEHGVTATLDLSGIGVSSHLNFACSPGTQPLDGEAWDFGRLSTSNGDLSIRFRLLVECPEGFDSYVLIIGLFDPDENSGPGIYDSDNSRIIIEHYAEKDDPDKPHGKTTITHGGDCCFSPFFNEPGHSITVAIAEL